MAGAKVLWWEGAVRVGDRKQVGGSLCMRQGELQSRPAGADQQVILARTLAVSPMDEVGRWEGYFDGVGGQGVAPAGFRWHVVIELNQQSVCSP
jgi:hypothetical protein